MFVKSLSGSFSQTVLLLATLLLICTGCDSRSGGNIGDTPPGISGNDIRGEYVSLGQLKGKVVIVYFWDMSCCGDSLKQVEPFYRKYQDAGLNILAINEQSTEKDVASFAATNGLTFTMLTDEHSMLFKQYRAFGFPTIFILDRNGIVREKILGGIQTAKLEKLALLYLGNKSEKK
jgi:peroxiredoxin